MIVILQNIANNVLNNQQTGCFKYVVSQLNHILLLVNKKGTAMKHRVPEFLLTHSFRGCVKHFLKLVARFESHNKFQIVSYTILKHLSSLFLTSTLHYFRILGFQLQLYFSLWKPTTSNSQKDLY